MAPVHQSWGVGSVLVLLSLAGLTGAAVVSLTQLNPAQAVVSADPARRLGSQGDAQTEARPDRDRELPRDLHRDPGFFASRVQLAAWTSTRIMYRRGHAGQCHPETGRRGSSRRAHRAQARAGRCEFDSQREHVTVARVEHLRTS